MRKTNKENPGLYAYCFLRNLSARNKLLNLKHQNLCFRKMIPNSTDKKFSNHVQYMLMVLLLAPLQMVHSNKVAIQISFNDSSPLPVMDQKR